MGISQLEFGLDTFGDVTNSPSGDLNPQATVIRDVVQEAVLADSLGIEFFGIGEHHRADFAVSAPEMVLAAAASRTNRIRLGSAVTVLSSDDPIRVFQRFSTLDALSSGRAEMIVGRGSFTESFPLFGLPLDQYEGLFEEKLDILVRLLRNERVNWSGTVRAPLVDVTAYPRPRLQTRSQPEREQGGEGDGGQEVVGELVVAGGDATEVLEPAEGVLDQVAIAVSASVVGDLPLARDPAWNDRHGAGLTERAAQAIGVVALVGQDVAGAAGAGQKPGATVMSETFPGVSVSAKGRPTTSVRTWILVVWPPREGPIA